MALQNVDTPLKGGMNTALGETDFSSVTPRHLQVSALVRVSSLRIQITHMHRLLLKKFYFKF